MNKEVDDAVAQGTPRTHGLRLGISARSQLRGFVMPEDVEDALRLAAELEAEVVELQKALQPFANYACDPPCECHNCKARMLMTPNSEPATTRA